MIPQHLHVVWLGSPLPAWARRHLHMFTDHNSGWAVTVHDIWPPPGMPAELVDLGNRCQQYCQLADLIYIKELATVGGVVMDLDSMTRRSFDPLLAYPAFSTRHSEQDRRITNGVMGGFRGAFSNVMDWLMNSQFPEKPRRCEFGPDLLTTHFDRQREDFEILPWSYFYPLHCGERGLADEYAAADFPGRERILAGVSDRWSGYGEGPFAVHLWGCDGSSHTEISTND